MNTSPALRAFILWTVLFVVSLGILVVTYCGVRVYDAGHQLRVKPRR